MSIETTMQTHHHHTATASTSAAYYYHDRVIYSNPALSNTDSLNYYNEIQMDDGKWTRDQTQILIDTWKEHKQTLLNSASSSADHFKIWKLIANEVNKLSPPKSLQQCKKKFRNIRYICKTAMNNNKQNGSKKHYPMFYSDFVEIISETERLKDNIRNGDTPSVEIIRETSADSMEYPSIDIEEYSPQNTDQQNGVIIKVDALQNQLQPQQQQQQMQQQYHRHHQILVSPSSNATSKPKNLLRTKNVSSFNSTDGSAHGSPHSHESGEGTSCHGGDSSESPSAVGGIEDQKSIDNEDIQKHEKQTRGDDNYSDENRSDTPSSRKHKNIDVSIMGRGYPPLKKIKRVSEVMFPTGNHYSSQVTNSLTLPPNQADNFPTMAALPQTLETTTALNYLSSAPLPTTSRKYMSLPNSHQKHYQLPQQHNNGYFMPHLATPSSRQASRDSIQRDNSFNTSFNDRMSERYDPRNGSDRGSRNHNDRFLDIQERQMELFSEMLSRHEQFLLRLLEQQRQAAEEAQKRDREFMLRLLEMFVKNN